MLRTVLLALVLCGTVLCAPAARSDTVVDFYRGKTVSLVVGYPPGGGYDLYTRMIARYISKYIPGNPTVIVQNMPGAGSLVSVNYLYNSAPKDGTVFGAFANEIPMMGILGYNANARFDIRKLTWLGTASSSVRDATLLWVRKDRLDRIEDALRPGGKEILIGTTAAGSGGNEWSTLLRDVVGVNLKIIPGYGDSLGIFLAVERGEVDSRAIDYTSVRALRSHWLDSNSEIRPVLQFGRATRHPDFPNIPAAIELVKAPRERAIIEMADLSNTISRPYAAPPDIPPDRAKALQNAFMAVLRDPGFLAEAATLDVEVSPVDGQEVLRRIERLAAYPPELLDYMKQLRMGSSK